MNKRLAGCIFIPTLILFVLVVAGYFYIQHANYHSVLDATKKWVRLNDFPATATDLTVETKGNMFSREFTVQFDAPLSDIESWLNESPGTREVVPTTNGSKREYSIDPGDDAIRAELDLEESTGHVTIRTCWS